jgi:membrane-bound lytic murein transglycosylase D
MKNKTLLALLFVCLSLNLWALDEVPEHLQFCDIELSLDASARAKIEESVSKIKRSPAYFQSLVDRANIYFPFVEEAFDLRGVPQDLKYIVIQESAMISNAVSSSNAVGFWQFKEESARESGLTIDEYVDERQHIFLSSLAAAKYFYTIARYYDNYLYAVIGYNRGPVGALPFTDEDGFGKHKMRVTGETHWYALKAIAHKLAYEDALGKTDPPMWLQPLNTHGETDVKKLATAQDLSLEDFKKYNTWIKGSKLPEGKDFIYYVPRQGKPEIALLRHVGGNIGQPSKKIGGDKVIQPIEKPKPAKSLTTAQRDTRKFDYLEINDDEAYGLEYVRVKENESLVEIAVRNGSKAKKLQAYNGFTTYHRPQAGDIVYLKPAKSRKYHIVQQGESLQKIAEIYGKTIEEIRAKNRMTGNTVYAGQKLNIKVKVAKGQKPTLLAAPESGSNSITEVEEEGPEEVKKPDEGHVKEIITTTNSEGILTADPNSYKLAAFESKLITHTVGPNESVWKVARKYGAYADVVKKLNNLSSNELKVGQQVKVLQVTDRQ